MKFTLNIGTKQAAFILFIIVSIVAIGAATAYNSGQTPDIMGHSAEELDLNPLHIDPANGRVGIGAEPTIAGAELYLYNGSMFVHGDNKGIRFQNTGAATSFWINSPTSSLFSIGGRAGTPPASGAINITNQGKVGIGKIPASTSIFALDVAGYINADDGLYARSEELRWTTGLKSPFIDFSNDLTSDFDVRLILTGDNKLELQGGSHDISELIPAEDGLEPGDVVVIDAASPERVVKSSKAYDQLVAGIYSTEPGFLIRGPEEPEGFAIPLALAGRVLVNATAENGAIELGDLLVTSSMPGYAMKCADYGKCQGAVLGKALEPLAEGTGQIKALVTLQ